VLSYSPVFSRSTLVAIAVCTLIALTSGPLATRADATSTPSLSGFDSRLLYDINHARAARGLRKLTVVAGTPTSRTTGRVTPRRR